MGLFFSTVFICSVLVACSIGYRVKWPSYVALAIIVFGYLPRIKPWWLSVLCGIGIGTLIGALGVLIAYLLGWPLHTLR